MKCPECGNKLERAGGGYDAICMKCDWFGNDYYKSEPPKRIEVKNECRRINKGTTKI